MAKYFASISLVLQMSPRMLSFLERTLERDPVKRASAFELLNHSFIRGTANSTSLADMMKSFRHSVCQPKRAKREIQGFLSQQGKLLIRMLVSMIFSQCNLSPLKSWKQVLQTLVCYSKAIGFSQLYLPMMATVGCPKCGHQSNTGLLSVGLTGVPSYFRT